MKKGGTPWQQGLSLYRLFSFYPAAVNQRLRQTSHSRNGACGPWVTSSRVWHHVRRTTYEDSRMVELLQTGSTTVPDNWLCLCAFIPPVMARPRLTGWMRPVSVAPHYQGLALQQSWGGAHECEDPGFCLPARSLKSAGRKVGRQAGG
jgi:hypothetical protein